MITVRNRLAITKKCMEALRKHSTLQKQVYIYNNSTNYRLDEHFEYFYNLFEDGEVAQVTFNTDQSTFGAFSKAVACNQFGLQHEQDPVKDKYKFLVFLDNDVIVTPGWDSFVEEAWNTVNKNKWKYVKVVSQLPGGIKNRVGAGKIAGVGAKFGKLGGSGLWCVRNNFFSDVGYLSMKGLVGHDKRHDISYWRIMEKATKGNRYILGVKRKLGIHCGPAAGSVCNVLTRHKHSEQRLKRVKLKKHDEKIEKMSFDDFYAWITTDKKFQGW